MAPAGAPPPEDTDADTLVPVSPGGKTNESPSPDALAEAATKAVTERSKLIAVVKQLYRLVAGTVKQIDLETRTITFKDNEVLRLDNAPLEGVISEEFPTSPTVPLVQAPSAPKPPLIASPADKEEQPWWSFPTPRGQSELDRISSMTPEQRKELQRQEKKAMRRMRYGG